MNTNLIEILQQQAEINRNLICTLQDQLHAMSVLNVMVMGLAVLVGIVAWRLVKLERKP